MQNYKNMVAQLSKDIQPADTLRHRAVCNKKCHWKGPWRTNINEAYEDSEQHRNETGHFAPVITEDST